MASLRSPRLWRNWRPRSIAGASMLAIGLTLLIAAGVYYTYVTFIATRGSEDLTVPANAGRSETLDREAPLATQASAHPSPAWQELYPGELLPARQWADPRGSLDLKLPEREGFTPISAAGRPSFVGEIGRAERITIPAIGVGAGVEELEIQDLGDSSAYLTPSFTVGHIPESPNPGSHGNGWYFGHLESPVSGEGNVFSRLPRVPEMLRTGDDVHVIVESGGREYLYLVSQTELIHEDDMVLYQASDARVTLVTCFPRLRYDQRLLVTAQLIGFRDLTA
ncbi:MAG: sortase [Chloroflexi bacterium]|nr:sortase [Chloroflexota bacterium]